MFCYIILHYKNISDTLSCIEKLQKIIKRDSKIIIVDNNTLTSDEYDALKDKANDIILSKDNMGYAKANNEGVVFAKEKYHPDYYVIMNNDVFITQKNFEKSIINLDVVEKFDILGPCIDSPTGESVNPFPVIKNKEEVDREISKCEKLIRIYSHNLLYLFLKCYMKIKHLIKKPIKNYNGQIKMYNVALHGCCIIFSKKYIEKYKYAFYNETFLFHEEEFIYQRIINDNLKSIYFPDIKVFHKEGSSVKKKIKSQRKQKLFREKERYKSLILLREVMNEKAVN